MNALTVPGRARRCARTPAIALLAALIGAASSCGDAAARSEQGEVQPKIEEVSDSSLVTVNRPERFALVEVTTRNVPDRLSGTCTVSPDVNRAVPVNALGGGRVVDLKARLGDQVTKGQVLVTISSPDLSAAQADHLKAVADEALARRQLDRTRLLYEHGSMARKDLEAAEDAADKARVDLRATEQRVRMLGGDPEQPGSSALIELRAPITGTIIEQNVTPAAGVKSPDNAPNLFTIADLSKVWVLCDVYENELPRARVGEIARVRLNAYPGQTFAGRIGNISQVLDPNTRTAKVRIELDNSAGLMRPGMFAVADLESEAARPRLVLPTTALVQMHDADWVFVQTGKGVFRRTQVHAGREVDRGLQEIIDGVAPGQQVVRNALELVQAVGQ